MTALSRLRPLSGGLLAIGMLLGAGLLVVGAPGARAQDFNWFRGILGGGTPQRSAPSYPGYDSGGYDDPSRSRERRHRAQHRRKAPASDQAESAANPKAPQKNATLFVGVFGDSLGVMLANGLDDALADRPEIGVLHEARGSTGLVAESFYNWPKTIEEQLSKQPKSGAAVEKTASKDSPKKIDVAVMMIGSNDRQPITEGGKTYQRGSEEWNTIYRKRVTAIAEAFQRRKIPLVWVGIPITKDDDFADDMAALNEIYRDIASKTGATYVDTWEAFADDNGNFAVSGPDINGQTVRLRSSDGIHFTPAGARKLAHFVEPPVRRDLDGKAPVPELPTAESTSDGKDGKQANKGQAEKDKGEKKEVKPAVAVAKPEAGPIKNLGELPSAKDGLLAQMPRGSAGAANGEPPSEAVPTNRADNFRWPAGGLPQP